MPSYDTQPAHLSRGHDLVVMLQLRGMWEFLVLSSAVSSLTHRARTGAADRKKFDPEV